MGWQQTGNKFQIYSCNIFLVILSSTLYSIFYILFYLPHFDRGFEFVNGLVNVVFLRCFKIGMSYKLNDVFLLRT